MSEIERVGRAVAALSADWERQEGSLRRSQFERLVLKRHLSLDEAVAVFKELDKAGIKLAEADSKIASGQALVERITYAPSEEFVPGFFSKRLLSHREEIELGRTIQLGLLAGADLESEPDDVELRDFVIKGECARTQLVEANLRLVLSIAHKLVGPISAEIGDLVQAGTIGLMRAAELYDPDLGLKFSTYATHWIRQAIFRGLDNFGSIIRLPVHRLESIRRLRRARRLLTVELSRQPTHRELAEALSWEPEKVAYIYALSQMRIAPMDEAVDENGLTLGDTIASSLPDPEQLYLLVEFKRLVHELVESLSPRQRMVLVRRFGLVDGREETLQQIGDDLEVTRERIRQIEVRALKRILPRAKFSNAAQLL